MIFKSLSSKSLALSLLASATFLLFATSACGGKTNDGPVCGNNKCEAGEDASSCASDCAASCGNGSCDAGETTANCSADCPAATCNNNGTCNIGEDTSSCPADCPAAACNNNGSCDAGETTANCAADCPAAACNNNGSCDAGETTANCAADCPAAACNNNGSCDAGETTANCVADCPATDVCTLVDAAQNIGTPCQSEAATFCGEGVCASFTQGTPASCFQACVPSQCETTCATGERCYTVNDANGNPIELSPGVPQGVCDAPPVGTAGAFDKCGGADGACQAKMDCLSTSATAQAFCLPQCAQTSECPARETIASQCVISTGGAGSAPSNCALVCDTATPSCPAGMTCTAMGNGALCMW